MPTFTGLTLTRAAAGYTILAASPTARPRPRPLRSPWRAGAPRSSSVAPRRTAADGSAGLTVAVVDVYGNLVTSYDGGVTVQWGSDASPRRPEAPSRALVRDGQRRHRHVLPPQAAAGSRRRIVQADADGLTRR